MSLHTGTYDSLPLLVRNAFDDRVDRLSRTKSYAVSSQRRYLGVYEQPGPRGPVPGQFQLYVVENYDGMKKYFRLGRVQDTRLGAFLYAANAADKRLCTSKAVSSFLSRMRDDSEFAALWLNAIESQTAAPALLRLSIDGDSTVKAENTADGLLMFHPHSPISKASQPCCSLSLPTATTQTPNFKPLPPISKPTPAAPVSSPEPPPPLTFGELFSRHYDLDVLRVNDRIWYHPDASLEKMHARLLEQPGYPFRDSVSLRKWIMTTFRHKLVLGNGASVEKGQIKASFCDKEWRFAGIVPVFHKSPAMGRLFDRCFIRAPDDRLEVSQITATLIEMSSSSQPVNELLWKRGAEFWGRWFVAEFADELAAGEISIRSVQGIPVIFGVSHRPRRFL